MSNKNKPTVGFHTNPERINKNGAPRREWTWAGLLADALEKEFASSSGKMGQAKKLITEKIVRMAIAGDITAQKEIMNRMDGMPKQSIDQAISIVQPILGGQTNVPTHHSDSQADETPQEN